MATPESREPERVRSLFGTIARRYDLLNHVLSFDRDRGWRRAAAVEMLRGPSLRVLDLCGGTGDLSVELAGRSESVWVVCCDFSHPMLERAAPKIRRRALEARCVLLEADGLRLPFADGTFDGVTVGFGVRNFVDLDTGLREIRRVLTPGGRMVVLEFSVPGGPVLSALYRFYLHRILPRLGDGATGRHGPYGYLARTIAQFPDAPGLAGRIRDAGFAAVGWTQLTGGIVAIHTAFR